LEDGIAALLSPKASPHCAGTAEGGAAVVLVLFLDPRPGLAAGGLMDDALLDDAAAAALLMDNALSWDAGRSLTAALLGVDLVIASAAVTADSVVASAAVMADSVMASAAVRLATEVS
jgi:hypothetical protein